MTDPQVPVSSTAPGPDAELRHAVEQAIAALQAQRAVLGGELVDAAIRPLVQRLAMATPHESAGTSERRLRQVTVLFLDIAGSTQLIQHLEPEDVQSVVDGALAAFAGIVARHGGEVLRYTGDSVKAAFGATVSREDDAERAVLCGLELLQEAARHRSTANQQQAALNARVGIHTGAAVRGGGVEREKSLSGLAVNIAARMEQTAPIGGLRISQDTWTLVRGIFDAQSQAPIAVKGLDAPVATWLVTGAKPRASRMAARGIDGIETPLVGRQDHMGRFEAAVEALLADRQPRTLTLLADAGLGKSRLLREFQHSLAARGNTTWLLPARAQPSGALRPYGLLRDLLMHRLDIADSDSADVAQSKFVQGLAPWLSQPNDPAPELLGQLIGLDFSTSPAVLRLGTDARLLFDRALSALGLWLTRLSASDGSPVVLLLDDLHWADDASLDALEKLLAQARAPILALLGARPGLLERRPDWGDKLPGHDRLTLEPLDAAQSAALSRSLLQRLGTMPAALAALIEGQSDGNPYYAEELVLLLIDQGVIERGADQWTFHADRMVPARLPTTLTAVLQSRIDALDGDARRALQMASVIGPVFWDDALAALDRNSPASLPTLHRKALVQARSASTIEHTVEEAFQHHLLHQVSYGTVLKPERREAHARAAAWLVDRVGDRSDEYLAITAQHHERAGQHAQAADCYDRAAIKVFARPAYKAALQYADSAQEQLALSSESWPPERAVAATGLRAKACEHQGLKDRQAEELNRMLAMGELHGNLRWVAQAMAGLTVLRYRQGRLEEAEANARRGAAAAEAADNPKSGAVCWGNLAWMAMERVDLDGAQHHLDAAMAMAVQARQRNPQADGIYVVQLLLIQCGIDDQRKQYSAVAASAGRALALAQGMNEPRLECSCHDAVATGAMTHADWALAATHIEAAARLAAEFDLPMSAATAHENRAELHLHAGRWEDAARESSVAMDADRAVGDVSQLQRSLARRAEALWRGGQHDEAAVLWQEIEVNSLQQGDEVAARCARLRLAEARSLSGHDNDLHAALQAVQTELPAMAQIGTLDRTYGSAARLAAWRVLDLGEDPEAAAQLALAETELQQLLDGFTDSAVRERVAHEVPWHRDILEALARTKLERSTKEAP